MKNIRAIASVIFSVAILIAAGWLVYFFTGSIARANPSVQAAIVAAAVAVASLIVTFWRERSRSIREAHREQKIGVYNRFYDIVFRMLREADDPFDASKLNRKSPLVIELSEVTRGVMFYGSPKVLKAFAQFKNMGKSDDKLHAFRIMGRIFLAMRDDIGLSNVGLDEITIHQLYVNDDLTDL